MVGDSGWIYGTGPGVIETRGRETEQMGQIFILLFTAVLYLLAIPCYLLIDLVSGSARRMREKKPVRKPLSSAPTERKRLHAPSALPYPLGMKPVGVVSRVEAR